MAVCRLAACHRFSDSGCPIIPESEGSFGDFAGERCGLWLEDVRRLPEPIPARGALGLWDWTPPEGWQTWPEVLAHAEAKMG